MPVTKETCGKIGPTNYIRLEIRPARDQTQPTYRNLPVLVIFDPNLDTTRMGVKSYASIRNP